MKAARLYIEPEAEAELETTADRYAESVRCGSAHATCSSIPRGSRGSLALKEFAAPTLWDVFRTWSSTWSKAIPCTSSPTCIRGSAPDTGTIDCRSPVRRCLSSRDGTRRRRHRARAEDRAFK